MLANSFGLVSQWNIFSIFLEKLRRPQTNQHEFVGRVSNLSAILLSSGRCGGQEFGLPTFPSSENEKPGCRNITFTHNATLTDSCIFYAI